MLTDEQCAVIEASTAMQPQEMLKIEACAGSGKTFTLLKVAKANPDKRFLYLAFNKAIVEEAKRRFPDNVEISTVHSLAWRWFAGVYGRQALRNLKGSYNVFDLQDVFADAEYADLSDLISRYRQFCYSAETEPQDQDVEMLFEAIKDGRIPMTHDFYLKLFQIECVNRFSAYDFVLLDEAQDTNPVTMALFTDNECRRILVGDTHQSIYAFRGAVNALENTQADKTLHLSYSFRSKQEILDRANFFLHSFAADKENFIPMKSKVTDGGEVKTVCDINRTNAGIILRLLDLIDKDLSDYRLLRPAAAIFGCALSLLAYKHRQFHKIFKEYSWLKKFPTSGAIAQYAEDCNDQEILANLRLVDNYDDFLYVLYDAAQGLAANENGTHVICTAHTAKGLEWDRVTLGNDFVDLAEAHDKIRLKRQQGEKNKGMSPQEFQQELNLYYVSVTRARYSLKDGTLNNGFYRKRR